MRILVTGGAGYIGSHTCVELLEAGHEVVVVDNLCNSSKEAIRRVEELTGKQVVFYEEDLLRLEKLEQIFKAEKPEAVIHFAGLKAVGESVSKPLEYYHNNITGTLNLCRAMRQAGVKKLVFSSSATVYGEAETMPITEDCPKGKITNPYGQTKAMLEQVLTDLQVSDPEWSVVLLRYFNPIGAHESGRIGEDPKGIPNNLLPYIAQVAVGKLAKLRVFGDDYETPDGTGIRDYIHVVDLASGHVKAVEMLSQKEGGVWIYNLGSGRGYSVLEVLHAFEKACGHSIPYEIQERRPGDAAICYAATEKAERELGFVARYDIERMCADTWRWQSNNPDGYPKENLPKEDTEGVWKLRCSQIKELTAGESDLISNLANAAALLMEELPDINWAGFYIRKGEVLQLGPFQGKPACLRIALGQGVCGTAAQQDQTLLVADVHQFPGHIACDHASRSEIVIPIHAEGRVVAVLDIDSPLYGRFHAEDQKGLETFVGILEQIWNDNYLDSADKIRYT